MIYIVGFDREDLFLVLKILNSDSRNLKIIFDNFNYIDKINFLFVVNYTVTVVLLLLQRKIAN